MNPPNGTLTHDTEHGYVWTTVCCACGTTQKIQLGFDLTLDDAREAVARIDGIPAECPGGWHVEMTGWRRFWSLDLMLTAYERALLPPQLTCGSLTPEPVGVIIPTLVGASEDGWAN